MNPPPCTRGLQQFKDGCPERSYNYADGTGCPLWIEKEVPTRGNPQERKMNKMCLDRWMWLFQWSILGALEGNQSATESFRNAMCMADPDDPMNPNKVQPKPDPAVLHLVRMLEEEKANRKIIIEHETKKLLAEYGIGVPDKDGKIKQLDHTCKPDHEVAKVSTTQKE